MRIGNRARAFGIAALLAAVLACLPWSGWMVRQQMRVATGGSLTHATAGRKPTEEERERERQTAATYPGDIGMQIASALQNRLGSLSNTGSGSTSRRGDPSELSDATRAAYYLWSLRERFPNEPSLYANILRYLTADAVRIARYAEQRELEPKKKGDASPDAVSGTRPYNRPTYLALFDDAAAVGERLDPENGYFPAMRAIGLFAAHQDSDALDAIRRASTRKSWEEYSVDEVKGSWRLMALTHGEPGVFARFGQASGLLLFHYAPLRSAVRLATVQAIHQEVSGELSDGFALRRDIARLGALMRVRSSHLIGSLIGISIVRTAHLRPGGAAPLAMSNVSPAEDDARESQIQAAYCEYLDRIGQPDEAAFVREEAAASSRVKNVLEASSELNFLQTLRPVAGAWVVGGALLSSLLVTLLAGGVSVALLKCTYLSHKTAFSVILILGLAAVGGTMTFLGISIIGPWNQWLALFQGMASYAESANDAAISDWEGFLLFLPQLTGVFVLCLPVLTLVIPANRSRSQSLPRASAFVRSYAASALPVTTVLLVLYSCVVVGTLCLETQLRKDADRLAAGECSFMAEITNQPLPGFSPGHYLPLSENKELTR